jgi:hypothetical protein
MPPFEPYPDSPYMRWHDKERTERDWASFDDDTLPKCGLLLSWLSGLTTATLIGAVYSFIFLLAGFPPAGAPDSTRTENLICSFIWCMGAMFLAEPFCFFDPELSTCSFWGYFLFFQAIICLVIRNVVEEATGAREDLI